MKEKGVPTAIYYPRPMHTQPVYQRYPVTLSGLSRTEAMAGDVLALPMHPYLEETAQLQVTSALHAALAAQS